MVAPIGQLQLANPLQNPVMTGMQQGIQTAYMPMMMAMQPMLNAAKMQYYSGKGQLAQQSADLLRGGYAGTVGQALYSLNNADPSGNLAQQYLTGMIGKPISEMNLNNAKLPDMQADAINKVQTAINNGAPFSLSSNPNAKPTLFNPMGGLPMLGNIPPITGMPSPANAGGNGIATVPTPNAPAQQTPDLQQQLNDLNTKLNEASSGQQSKDWDWNQYQSDPTYADKWMQANPNAPAPTMNNVGSTSVPPQYITTKINAMPSFVSSLDTLLKYAQDPEVQQYNGNSLSAITKRTEGYILAKRNEAPPGYQKYIDQQGLKTSAAESASKALTGSAGVRPMSWYVDQLDPTKYPTTDGYATFLKSLANQAKETTSAAINQNYKPAYRQQAWKSTQAIVNSDVYKYKGNLTPGVPSSPNGSSSSASNSSLVPGVPDSFSQQYSKQKGWL